MTKFIISTSAAYIAARSVLGDHRKLFDSPTDAVAALRSIFAKEGFPADFPVVAAGVEGGALDFTESDTIPPVADWNDVYRQPGVRVAVSFIGVRGIPSQDDPTKKLNGARGFAVYPVHSIDSIQANESGADWLWKLIEKEMSHVAFRGLRGLGDEAGLAELTQAAIAMPVSVGDYVEESTRDGMDTSAFDSVWKQFRTMLQAEAATAPLVNALPQKAEVVKSIRSAAYARDNYPQLEKIKAFEFIANTMVKVIGIANADAIEKGEETIDAGEIAAWAAKRDTFVFPTPAKKNVDLGGVDFGAFMNKLGG